MIALNVGFAEVLAVAKGNPSLPLGLLLVCTSSVSAYYMYGVVRDTGFRHFIFYRYILEFHRQRKQESWPVWPIYLYWISLVAGIPILTLGLIHL